MESPPNWVKERADCNLDMVFEALFSVADRDVTEVNRVSSLTKNGVSFAVQREDGGMLPTFRVDRKKGGKSVEHVSFQKDQYQIAIVRSVPIRLSPIPTTSRVLPIPRVKLGLGRAAISPAMSSAS